MAGRNHVPPQALRVREIQVPLSRGAPQPPHAALIDDPRLLHRVPHLPAAASRPHPALVEERIAANHWEIQTLLLGNQRLAAAHVALKQDLASAQQELRRMDTAAAAIKAERDAQVREVFERSRKMEAEVRSIDARGAELAQVMKEVQKLTAPRQELTAELQAINGDLARARSEAKELPAIKAEIETMHQELQRGRAAIEYEKKTLANNLEQTKAMEKDMLSMAREIEKLRAELANAEKRARAAAAAAANPGPGYTANYGNGDIGYGGNSYPNPHAMYEVPGAGVDGGSYGSGPLPRGPYNMQQTHVQR